MKVAIIGNGLKGLEVASTFLNMDASVKIFGNKITGGILKKLDKSDISIQFSSSWKQLTQSSTRKLINLKEDLNTYPTIKEFNSLYLNKLINTFPSDCFVSHKVLRVSKRFLHKEENFSNNSRLVDLFRVVYEKKHNSIDNLPSDLKKSLSEKLEYFEDFDIVINSFQINKTYSGPGGSYAINEKYYPSSIYYGTDFLKKNFININSITIIGSGLLAASALLFLKRWITDDKELFWITSDSEFLNNDFKHFENLKKEVFSFMDEEKTIWQNSCKNIEEDIFKSRNNSSSKLATEPDFKDPRLKILKGYEVTSIDKLTESDKLYLTIEIPEFRGKSLSLTTISTDVVISVTDQSLHNSFDSSSLQESEVGFYTINKKSDILESVNYITNDLTKYFKRI